MQHDVPATRLCLALTLAVVLLWQWPVLLGQQPAGGDVTSFFYPLMVHYQDRLKAGELPLWNPLWGYGFPGLAESQMGVFYPPHLILYGLLNVDAAYSLNLLLHLLLAAAFAFWCARTFGLSPWGAALAAIVFARGGFFVTQLSHQWAYTTGCWLPLALLLTWKTLSSPASQDDLDANVATVPAPQRSRRVFLAFCLALVLAVQMLAGHFQLAFYTHVSVLLLAAVRLAQGLRAPEGRQARALLGSCSLIVIAWASALGLAAIQLLPTAELVEYSSSDMRHDLSYLSKFANPPWHVFQYGFPLLLHRNPLWRTVAWDPWFTSPEESLVYVGLAPVCLAMGAVWRWRRDRRIQGWTVLLVVSFLLSMGPFLPGFYTLIRLPGFGWFRGAARWSLVSTLALGILAGYALDRVDRSLVRRWAMRLTYVWGAALLLVVAAVAALTLPSDDPNWLTESLNAAWHWVAPFEHDVDLYDILDEAKAMQGDEFSVLGGLVQLGGSLEAIRNDQCTLVTALPTIAWQELMPSALAVAALVAIVFSPLGRGRFLAASLVVFTIADLAMLGLVTRVEWVAGGNVQKSRLLEELAEHARGRRVVAPYLDNLPMAVGAAPLIAYRTLEIPVFPQYFGFVTNRETAWNELPEPTSRLLRLSAAQYHVVQGMWPHGMRSRDAPSPTLLEAFSDPLFSEFEFGEAYAEQLQAIGSPAVESRIYRAEAVPSRAWVVAESTVPRPRGGESDLPKPETVEPVTLLVDEPEHLELEVEVDEPSILVVTDLFYPGWEASKTDAAHHSTRVPIEKMFGAWRGIRLEEPGRYRLEMRYRCAPLRRGATLASCIALGWGLVLAILFLRRRKTSSRSVP